MFPRERGTSGSARSARDQDEADASRSGPPSSVPDAANSSRPERARPLGADVQRPEPVGAAAAAAPQGPGAAATPSWPPAPRPPPPQGWQGAGRHDGGRGVQPELGYIRRQLQAVVIVWGRAQKTERERVQDQPRRSRTWNNGLCYSREPGTWVCSGEEVFLRNQHQHHHSITRNRTGRDRADLQRSHRMRLVHGRGKVVFAFFPISLFLFPWLFSSLQSYWGIYLSTFKLRSGFRSHPLWAWAGPNEREKGRIDYRQPRSFMRSGPAWYIFGGIG